MPRIKLRDFSGGLWVAGPSDAQPPTSLRRAKGVHSTPTRSVRSRWGSSLILFGVDAHSLVRFGTDRYQIDSTSIYRNGVAVTPYGGGSGRAAFARMPPLAGVVPPDLVTTPLADYLFVAGGRTTSIGGVLNESALVKFDSNGAVSRWGLSITDAVTIGGPFGVSFFATKIPHGGVTIGSLVLGVQDKTIDAMDVTTGWSATGSAGAPTPEATITQGGGSVSFTLPAASQGGMRKIIVTDLMSLTNADATTRVSPDEDWIMLAVRVDFPARLERLTLTFGLDANFNNAYAKNLIIDDHVRDLSTTRPKALADLKREVGHAPAFIEEASRRVAEDALERLPSSATFRTEALDKLGNTVLAAEADTWAILRISKALFVRRGESASDWSNVTDVKIAAETNSRGPVKIYIDDIKLRGGVGMIGDYRYAVTFKNSVTGNRSNPIFDTGSGTMSVEDGGASVEDVSRQPVLLLAVPTSPDPQVDRREIWRTVGGGAVYFKLPKEIEDNTTTIFVDEVADYIGLHGASESLVPEVVHEDNIPPSGTYDDAEGPHLARMWWTRDGSPGAAGRVYFSPAGRPEAVEGFIIVTSADDPGQKIVRWNGSLFALSESRMFEIVGTDIFVSREVFGAPGTTKPFSVRATPFGIVYQAADGLRVFNGVTSSLLGFEPLSVLFRGEASEGIPAFEAVVAAYGRSELLVSDGVTTLAYDPARDRWRNLGLGTTALFYEEDQDVFVGTALGLVLVLEVEGSVLDFGGVPIPFEVQTQNLLSDASRQALCQYLYIDVEPAGQVLTPTLIIDGGTETPLATITGTGRRVVEYPLSVLAQRLGVRLAGSVSQRVELFGVELDIRP